MIGPLLERYRRRYGNQIATAQWEVTSVRGINGCYLEMTHPVLGRWSDGSARTRRTTVEELREHFAAPSYFNHTTQESAP